VQIDTHEGSHGHGQVDAFGNEIVETLPLGGQAGDVRDDADDPRPYCAVAQWPSAAVKSSILESASQVNSLSGRPKWP
jgi:hypothetical protein